MSRAPSKPPRPRLMQRFLRFMSDRRILSDARMLEFYPPFWFMRIKVLEMDPKKKFRNSPHTNGT